jgi:DNA-directed RNA polymerase specialized sigma24 family protein
MSRSNAFDAFARESHERLLLQVYAFCGDPDVARRALADGYVSAAQHWRRAQRDPDAWVRSRAFHAAGHRRNRSREPWFQRAKRVPDEHRRVLAALAGLPPADRHLFIASELGGLDPTDAGREAGIPATHLAGSVERSAEALRSASGDPSGSASALTGLRDRLPAEHVDAASRLRARGDRRRRESWLLAAGVVLLVVAVAAGSLNAARRPGGQSSGDRASRTTAPASTPTTSRSPTAALQVTRTDLAGVSQVAHLDESNTWVLTSTSSDFADRTPVEGCLDAAPTAHTAVHYWTRAFSAGRIGARVEQALEVRSTPRRTRRAYSAQLTQLGTCPAGSHRVVSTRRVRGVGDAASLVTEQYAKAGRLITEQVAMARTGSVLTTWVVAEPHLRPVRPVALVALMAAAVDKVCDSSGGACASRPYRIRASVPPPDPEAPGFLSTVDLPLFATLSSPWVATSPAPTTGNPSATECDRADFSGAGAGSVRARSYVIPASRDLPDTFGMSETIGTFGSAGAAASFMKTVASSVSGCANRRLTLAVGDTATITTGSGSGHVWRVLVRTSPSSTLVFRVALVRTGRTVAEVTFTPSGSVDVGTAGFVTVATRALARLSQL